MIRRKRKPRGKSKKRPGKLDTHELVETPEGVELRMYPKLIADVRYDYYAGTWFVVPPGEEPVSLDLPNFKATDEEITAALHQLPIVYRSVVHR